MPAFRCPQCKAPFRVPDQLAGKHVKCPSCGRAVALLAVVLLIGVTALTISLLRNGKNDPNGQATVPRLPRNRWTPWPPS